MTPAQQAALESLVGRALTADEQAAIEPYLEARNDVAIAEVLSAGRVKPVPTDVGNGTILETIGLDAGNALLDVLNQAAEFRHVKPLLEQGRLRVDSALVRATLDGLVPAVLTAEQAQALKALAEHPDPIHYNAVSDVLNIAEGRLTLGG